MATIPKTLPPLPRRRSYARDLPVTAAFGWLRAGWRDFKVNPASSLLYGLAVFVVSVAVVVGLFALALDYILLPALAGFMVVGPLLAVGLYEKSRRIVQSEPVTLASMVLVRPRSGGQVLFTGALLCLLMLFWMRVAVLLYALFFGLRPFPGLEDVLPTLFATPTGVSLVAVGTLVGGLFAAFSFAISAFSVPMLLDERVDAFTAMGTSMALVWNNLPVMLTWGAIVLALFIASVATGLVGLIVVFPVLGHATWHAYQAMRA
ncbi:MAG: hypothetical protein CMM50_11865 [Rhodospirillaceae bacterium]|nr:hypothetical protein [Rhodospirillaceae bacterium]